MIENTDTLLADFARVNAAGKRINAARREYRAALKAYHSGNMPHAVFVTIHDATRARIADAMLAAVESATGIASAMPLDDADAAADAACMLMIARA